MARPTHTSANNIENMGDLFEIVVREAESYQPRESVVVEVDALQQHSYGLVFGV